VVPLKIEKISISNFGIIADVVLDLTSGNGNLVFVNGENGRGKTTFQSALRWCFYGKEPPINKFLSSYILESSDSGALLNTSVSVQILMDDASTAFVERMQVFQKTDSGTSKRVGQPKLSIKTRKSETGSFVDVLVDPEIWIRKYFPERLINFFLFDGELMKNFFAISVKGAIENAVKEIAGVDMFESIASNLSQVETSLNRKISRLTGTKAEKINEELELQRRLMEDIYSDYRLTEAELNLKKERKSEVVALLEGVEGLGVQSERLKVIEADLEVKTTNLGVTNTAFQMQVLASGTNSLLQNSFAELRKKVAHAEKEDRLPPPFEPARILQLIEDETCLCGAHLEPKSKAVLKLEAIIEKYTVASDVGRILDTTSRQIDLIEVELRSGWQFIQDKNNAIIQLRADIDKLTKERDSLVEKLQGHDVDSIRLLATERKNLDRQIEALISKFSSLKEQGGNVALVVDRLDKEFSEASKGNAQADELKKQAHLANQIASAAGKIHSIAIQQVRQQLQNSISEKFKLIMDGDVKTQINENFEVRTLRSDGTEIELSEGQNMMKAYIFSIALREVINLGFPLIVDTPLGRLGEGPRTQLASMLSNLLTQEISESKRQVIFLMHDGEYTPYTRKHFADSHPTEVYLAYEPGFDTKKSILGKGIDPNWLKFTAWKDWAEEKIK
jgi:DNA sulfur modification protein DndD